MPGNESAKIMSESLAHSANSGDMTDAEPSDNPCERCGHPTPRLVFDEVRRILLCCRCLEWIKSQEGWCLLSETENV
jgi:hypothetical protein